MRVALLILRKNPYLNSILTMLISHLRALGAASLRLLRMGKPSKLSDEDWERLLDPYGWGDRRAGLAREQGRLGRQHPRLVVSAAEFGG